ncbi:MAG TPA: choice-of-anchor D domain-containing protein, partial [bacterium]
LTISNTGNELLIIYSVSCGDACFTTDYDPADSLIAAGDSLLVTVSFAPAIAQVYDAILHITNNDEPVEVPLSGTGTPVPAPQIVVSAEILGFGEVLLGEQRELPLSIYNIGEADLIIYDISASEACYSTNFDPADSLILPGDSLNISVIFTPSFVGNIEDLLNIENNDQAADVLLIGCGLTPNAYNPDPSAPPLSFALLDPYPTPFNAQTVLSYQLPVAGQVNLQVYDLTGRMVAELVNGMRDPGVHQVTWDASGLPSGLYFCRIQAGSFANVVKMMLIK